MAEDSGKQWCDTCNEERPSDAVFCQKCAAKVKSRPPEPKQEHHSELPKADVPKFEGKGPTKKKTALVVTIVSALVIGGGVIGSVSFAQQQREEQLAVEAAAAAAAAAEERRLGSETLVEAFGQVQISSYLPSCEQISGLVSADEGKWEVVVAAFDGVSDPREASRVLDTVRSANGMIEDADVQAYSAGLENEIRKNLGALYGSSARVEQAPFAQVERWESEWFTLSRDTCPTEFKVFDSTYESLQASAAQFLRMSALASQVPWYPEGFDNYGDSIAYKWTTREGSWPCNNCSFWKITIVAKDGCPSGLYAELNILRGESVVDWTNDSLPSLRAGEPGILTFVDYPYNSANKGRLVELNCR